MDENARLNHFHVNPANPLWRTISPSACKYHPTFLTFFLFFPQSSVSKLIAVRLHQAMGEGWAFSGERRQFLWESWVLVDGWTRRSPEITLEDIYCMSESKEDAKLVNSARAWRDPSRVLECLGYEWKLLAGHLLWTQANSSHFQTQKKTIIINQFTACLFLGESCDQTCSEGTIDLFLWLFL